MLRMTDILLVLALVFAVLDWIAVYPVPPRRKLEFIAKPLATILLFAWYLLRVDLNRPALWFGLGLLFCILGDIFMLWMDRLFIAGLLAFLVGHGFYIFGFIYPPPDAPLFWTLGLAFILALGARRVLKRIIDGLIQQGKRRLALPVAIYGIVITLMLLSAMLTAFRVDWNTLSAALVGLGAFLFYISDILLAFNKFVQPINKGRVMNMAAYHLAQLAIITGVVIQFGQ